MRKIAIYGKGGIGKSTTTANLSAAMAEKGLKIVQIGCDPKHDSTRTLVGDFIPTVLDRWRMVGRKDTNIRREEVLFTGFGNVLCAEAGGPDPGVGCAGRGVIRTFEILTDLGIFAEDFDFAFFDVLGDVVCGGFAKPIQSGYAKEVYIVTSGEFMSVYAANNIAGAIYNIGQTTAPQSRAELGGIIGNLRGIENEEELLRQFASALHAELIHCIPRDATIQSCERGAKTVIEGAPVSAVAAEYRILAEKIQWNRSLTLPTPMTFDGVVSLCREFDLV